MLPERANNEIDQLVRGQVLGAYLNDAWCRGTSEREYRPEIKIVGEDNIAVLLRPSENDWSAAPPSPTEDQ